MLYSGFFILWIRPLKTLRRLLGKIGPGFVTGAADDDPSGIATYSQTGAIFGYGQFWLVWFTASFMIVIQQMCGRIGMVTGKGLAGVILEHYSRKVLYVTVSMLMIANRKDIVGQFVNSRVSNALGWMIVLIMTLAGLALIVNLATGQ